MAACDFDRGHRFLVVLCLHRPPLHFDSFKRKWRRGRRHHGRFLPHIFGTFFGLLLANSVDETWPSSIGV